MSKAKWPAGAAVFQHKYGTLYECVDVRRGRLVLLSRVEASYLSWAEHQYSVTPRQIEGITAPMTDTARAMLEIAKEGCK